MINFDNDTKYGKDEMYMYYDVLLRNNKPSTAKKIIDRFVLLYPNDSRAVKYKNSKLSMSNIKSSSALFEKEKLFEGQTSKLTGVVHGVTGNKILFSSNKDTTFLKNTKFALGRRDYDLYSLDVNLNNNFLLKNTEKIRSLNNINSSFDDYGITSTVDGSKIYFVSNRPIIKDKKAPVVYRNIIYFIAVANDGHWSDPKPVSFDDGISDYRMPSLSKDGKKLYFASNQKGGIGGYDIYSADIEDSGNFKNIKNLGSVINTEMDEDTPYISSNNILYFASNGHSGFGGFDIYSLKLNEPNSQVLNLGTNVNTITDDICFIFDEERRIGFYSSKVGDGYVVQRVSRIDKEFNPSACEKAISVIVYDIIDKKPLADTEVSLYDSQGLFIEKTTTDSNGIASFLTNCLDPNIYLQVTSKNYIDTGKLLYKMEETTFNYNIKIGLQLNGTFLGNKDEGIFLKTNYINFGYNGYTISEQSKLILDEIYKTIKAYETKIELNIYSHADNRGSREYNLWLTGKRSNAVKDYLVAKGFTINKIHTIAKGEDFPIEDCGGYCNEKQHQINRQTFFEIKSIDK